MSKSTLYQDLQEFENLHRFFGKGPLCVALVVTDHARTNGLPLEADKLRTTGGGQVLGLGLAAVQSILKRHGIEKVLAREGGRTSRNSLQNMEKYVGFLNNLQKREKISLDAVEEYWIERVRAFFAGKPFKFKIDSSKSLRWSIKDLLDQAALRQRAGSGMQYTGAVAQHLIAAKLRYLLGKDAITAEGFSTADEQLGRAGDFNLGDVAVHVSITPTEMLLQKASENLAKGLRPVIVTTSKNVAVTETMMENLGLAGRIDVFDIEQFVATNLYEHGRFNREAQVNEIEKLITEYNQIIDEVETDPSLKLEV